MVISIVIVMGCARVVGSYCVEPKCTGMPYDVVSWSGGSSASIPSRAATHGHLLDEAALPDERSVILLLPWMQVTPQPGSSRL